MGNSKVWRFSDRLPVSIQVALLFVSLILILSTVSFQMLPTSTWGDNIDKLVLGVSWVTSVKNTTSSSTRIGHNFTSTPSPIVDNLHPQQQPDENSFSLEDSSPMGAPDYEETAILVPPPSLLNSTADGNGNGNSSRTTLTPETNSTTSMVGAAPLVSSPVPAPAPSVVVDTREKFMAPLLSFQVGAGNQMMEYMSGAVIARALNRTYCLSPFFPGPSRHNGRVVSGLRWEDRYEVSSLSRFTRVASFEQCLEECNYTLDHKWMLKTSRDPQMQGWRNYPANNESLNLDWNYAYWTSPEDILKTLGGRDERCVGMLGLFPGLRWRGAFLAISAFLQPAPRIVKLADTLQAYALGKNTRYLAVHWRFEESECGPHNIGLCFVRCEDGSVIDTGLHAEAKEWHEAAKVACNKNGHFRGVTLDMRDILDAIEERAANHSVKTIYFATDGWLRGPQGIRLVKEVVHSLRRRGLTVVGLWKLPGLPNFKDGKEFDPVQTLGKTNQDLNGAQIALVEQELVSRAVSFMGSGQSTWSLAVFRVRLARRRVKEIVAAAERDVSVDLKDPKAVDKLISETLLRDEHPAGLHCRYIRYLKRAAVNETMETSADEYPDAWLDLEACEGRIGKGGRCQVAKCF
ncbi:hypothetical protein M758_4G178600 [Ceratodon purpureus]|nr:hypothetical protein M758_4G178600 [Ceratodon purpureus]